MKKIILAAAIASVLAPLSAVADTKVYGAVRASLLAGGSAADGDTFVNNASRVGLKGSVGDDGGLKGFYHIQMGLTIDKDGKNGNNLQGSALTNRFAFAGVQGGFGKVVVGRLSSPYKMAGLKTDPFYDTSAGSGNGGANFGLSGFTNGFLNNVIGYISPKLGGAFTVNAVAVLNNDDANGGTGGADDFYNLGVSYGKGPFTASVQHITEHDATRLAGTYKAGPIGVGLSLEDVDGTNYAYVSGTYKVAPKLTLAASFGDNDTDNGYSLGAFYKVASKTTLSLITSDIDNGRDVTALGFVQKF